MAEKIEKTFESTDLGAVRLEASELMSLLRESTSEDQIIFVEVNGVRMSGLSDIEENISLLEGRPKIEIRSKSDGGAVLIEFSDVDTRIYSYRSYVGANHEKFTNLFRKYQTWPSKISILLWPAIALSWLSIISGWVEQEVWKKCIRCNNVNIVYIGIWCSIRAIPQSFVQEQSTIYPQIGIFQKKHR